MDDLKSKIFDDLARPAEFAEAIGKTTRTVRRLRLPTIKIGGTAYIVVSKAKEQLLSSGASKTRGPGRPRKIA